MSPLLVGMARALSSSDAESSYSYSTTSSDAPDIAPSSNPFPVEPGGFFVGGMLACILYGIHVSQIYTYFSRVRWRSVPRTAFGLGNGNGNGNGNSGSGGSNSLPPAATAPLPHRLVVLWVFTLSTLHVFMIVMPSGYWYFVGGLREPERWGRFYWMLSVQDGVIPVMAATAQLYFGHRAWCLIGRVRWFKWVLISMVGLTLAMGVCLAVGAHEYSSQPSLPTSLLLSLPISNISESFSITWMALSATIDGTLTLILVYKFARARSSALWTTRRVARRLVALTLETVLLTHIVGATMCILFLSSDKRARTRNNLFWVLLEVMAELYALSVLFTVMSHERTRRGLRGDQHWGWESSISEDESDNRDDGRGDDGRQREHDTMQRGGGPEGDSGRNGQGGQVRHAQRRGGQVRDRAGAGAGAGIDGPLGSGNSSDKPSSGKRSKRSKWSKRSEPRDLSQSELDRRVEGYQTQNRISITTLPYHQPRQRQRVNDVPVSASGLLTATATGTFSASASASAMESGSNSSKSTEYDEKARSRDTTTPDQDRSDEKDGWHGGSTVSNLLSGQKGEKEEGDGTQPSSRGGSSTTATSALGLALGSDHPSNGFTSAYDQYSYAPQYPPLQHRNDHPHHHQDRPHEYAYMPTLEFQQPSRAVPARGISRASESGVELQLFADASSTGPASPWSSSDTGMSTGQGQGQGGLGLDTGTVGGVDTGSGFLGLDLGPPAPTRSTTIPSTAGIISRPPASMPSQFPFPSLPPANPLPHPDPASLSPAQPAHAPLPVSPRRRGKHLTLADEGSYEYIPPAHTPSHSHSHFQNTALPSDNAQSRTTVGLSLTVPPTPNVPIDNTLTPLYSYTPLGTAVPIPIIAVQGRTVSFGQAVERGILGDAAEEGRGGGAAAAVAATPRLGVTAQGDAAGVVVGAGRQGSLAVIGSGLMLDNTDTTRTRTPARKSRMLLLPDEKEDS